MWDRFQRALADVALPAAVVDVDALDRNVDRVARYLGDGGKTVRIATKSIRSPALVARIRARGGERFRGLMTYTAAETAYWAREGERDLLLAYPTVQRSDLAHLIEANRAGAVAAVVVDSEAHVAALSSAGRDAGVTLPVVIDVDMSFRPAGERVHIGVRRSPLREVEPVVGLAERIARDERLRFHGLMGYEAQIAGVGDRGAGWKDLPMRLIKRRSWRDVTDRRSRIAAALAERGLRPTVFNGGGSGSMRASTADPALTEVTAGSAFLCSHLFDHYAEVRYEPTAYFAVQVVRRPSDHLVTCHGGGYVASGAVGPDRLPVPALPPGLSLLPLEGAGEVQTPLRVPSGVRLAPGDPVLFRHAKAGELAEHVNAYLLVSGDRVIDRAPTYRGLGLCFLG